MHEQPRIAIVLKGYPRLSETFIAQELLALQSLGLEFIIVSMRHPSDLQTHPVHEEIQAPVVYLPEYLHQEPRRVVAALWRQRRRAGWRAAARTLFRDLRVSPTRHQVRRFGQALVLADELPESVKHLHVHFLHTPATMTRYVSHLTGLPWSGSAHAKDIWTQSRQEIAAKLRDCTWLVTCTEANYRYLRGLSDRPDTVDLVYHGLDFGRFPAPGPADRDEAQGGRILSVGRAVAKKGFDVLLQALARLDPALDWHWTHIGGGEQLQALQDLSRSLGIDARIEWLGPRNQSDVLAAYRNADVFALPCRIDAVGDRDGLPNVLMEAQSQALACVSTRVSGVPELIIDGQTGCLVEPDNPEQLAVAIEQLLRDPRLRERFGRAGQRRVTQHFAMQTGIRRLAERFGLPVPDGPVVRP